MDCHQGPYKGKREAGEERTEAATVLVLKKEGVTSQGTPWRLEAGKGNQFSPTASKRNPAPLMTSSARVLLDFPSLEQ